jgi:hypothetical protein
MMHEYAIVHAVGAGAINSATATRATAPAGPRPVDQGRKNCTWTLRFPQAFERVATPTESPIQLGQTPHSLVDY